MLSTYKYFDDAGQSASLFKYGWTDTFNGTQNPYFLGQIHSHTDATTGASWFEAGKYSQGTCRLTVKDTRDAKKQAVWTTDGHFVPLASLNTVMPPSTADANARIAFRNKVREVQTSFQGGTFLGELREAVHGIKHPAQALRRGVDDLITATRRNAKQALRGHTSKTVNRIAVVNRIARDSWLEWCYDKRPLISDVNDFANAIVSAPSLDTQGVIGRSDDRTSDSYTNQSGMGYMPVNIEYRVMRYRRTSVRYLGAVKMESETYTRNLLRRFGLDWSNVVPTAWELVPYSFLVDYFSNVGAMIDAAATTNFAVCWGCKTVIQETREFLLSYKLTPYSPASGFISQQLNVSSYVNYERSGSRSKFNTADVQVSILDTRLRMPGVDSLKWLNIAALANGAFFRG
jgi:hypothetical protein